MISYWGQPWSTGYGLKLKGHRFPYQCTTEEPLRKNLNPQLVPGSLKGFKRLKKISVMLYAGHDLYIFLKVVTGREGRKKVQSSEDLG